jgi:hypothetical protein
MYAPLASERRDGFNSPSVFKSSTVIDRRPVHTDIRAPKIGGLEMGTKTQNAGYLEND